MAKTEKTPDQGKKANKVEGFGRDSGPLATLDDLYRKQVEWSNTAVKAMNDGLIDLLGECLTVYHRLRTDQNSRDTLAKVLKVMDLEAKDGVHTATRVTRYVFRANNKRVTGYATVIRAAIDHEIVQKGFAEWVKSCGGLDQIRRKKKDPAGNKLTPRQMSDKAKDILSKANSVHVIRKPAKFLKSSDNALDTLAVALVRYNTQSGDAEIVYGTDNAAVTRHLLTAVAKDVLAEADKAEQSAKGAVNRAARKAAIAELVGDARVSETSVKTIKHNTN